MTVSIDQQEIGDAIDYFSSSDYKPNNLQLGCFFICKGIGFDTKNKHYYQNWKQTLPDVIWLFSSVYDPNEEGKKFCFIYPFDISNSIKGSDFYNPATSLSQIASRFRDTIDNSIVDSYIEKLGKRKDDTEGYLFVNNYISIVKEFLVGGKINLKKMLCWVYRFNLMEFEDIQIEPSDLYHALKKKFISDFNLSELEIKELFAERDKEIQFKENVVGGEDLRSMLPTVENVVYDYTNVMINYISSKIFKIPKTTSLELIMYLSKNPPIDYIIQSLELKGQLILYSAPGASKSYTVKNEIAPNYDTVFTVQFHPSTTYQDFIGGIRVKHDGTFTYKDGILLKAIEEALKDENKKILLFIDEINRGDLSGILGEAILALDREYEVELLNYRKENDDPIKLKIPKNLHIVGTMNSSDRSISIEDKAILRRFNKVRLFVNYDLIESLTDSSRIQNIALHDLLKKINEKIFSSLNDPEFQIGHAYFMPDELFDSESRKFVWTETSFLTVFNDAILPLIEEYTVGSQDLYSDITGSEFGTRYYQFSELKEKILDLILE